VCDAAVAMVVIMWVRMWLWIRQRVGSRVTMCMSSFRITVSGGINKMTRRMRVHRERLVLLLTGLPSWTTAPPRTHTPRVPFRVLYIRICLRVLTKVRIAVRKAVFCPMKGGTTTEIWR